MSRNWAIAIGINQYQYLNSLRYARHDAEAFQTFMLIDLECDRDKVWLCSDRELGQPHICDTNRTVEPKSIPLQRFLRQTFEEAFLEEPDTLWFFYAGHGIRYQGRDYLMPADGDPGNVERTAIRVSYVTERLCRSGAGNVVLMFDACRSLEDCNGRARGQGVQGVGSDLQQGVVTFYSCSPAESSYEIKALEHGSFTYALLEGLRMHGANNCATVQRLEEYLSWRVPNLNRAHRQPSNQNPYAYVAPASRSQMVLVAKHATNEDLIELKIQAYRAQQQENYPLAKQFWIQVLAISPADTDAINAIPGMTKISPFIYILSSFLTIFLLLLVVLISPNFLIYINELDGFWKPTPTPIPTLTPSPTPSPTSQQSPPNEFDLRCFRGTLTDSDFDRLLCRN